MRSSAARRGRRRLLRAPLRVRLRFCGRRHDSRMNFLLSGKLATSLPCPSAEICVASCGRSRDDARDRLQPLQSLAAKPAPPSRRQSAPAPTSRSRLQSDWSLQRPVSRRRSSAPRCSPGSARGYRPQRLTTTGRVQRSACAPPPPAEPGAAARHRRLRLSDQLSRFFLRDRRAASSRRSRPHRQRLAPFELLDQRRRSRPNPADGKSAPAPSRPASAPACSPAAAPPSGRAPAKSPAASARPAAGRRCRISSRCVGNA